MCACLNEKNSWSVKENLERMRDRSKGWENRAAGRKCGRWKIAEEEKKLAKK